MKNIHFDKLLQHLFMPDRWKLFQNPQSNHLKLPAQLTIVVILICVFPSLLNLLGIEFASPEHLIDFEAAANMSPHFLDDELHHTLAGSFTHTILEWSAFCAAIFTTILAFAHFSIQRDVTTPVIGVALLCAGLMDGFHTLAADRLIDAVADNRNLIPFTWAICRLLNALLTTIGVSIFLLSNSKKWQGHTTIVTITSLLFGFIAYSIIKICATSNILPETTFSDFIITRPWDVAPLILFSLAGLFIYPKFYQKYPSVFAHSLIISTIPNAVTQTHMAFGSTALFDNHFNIAHFLKIIAYLVPLSGLIIDYIATHRQLKDLNQNYLNEIEQRKVVETNLRDSETLLKLKNEEINQSLLQLKTAQIQLVQREKMASLGNLVGGMAHEINNPINFVYGNISHAQEYIQSLLDLIYIYQEEYQIPTPKIQETLAEIDLEFIEEDLPKLLTSMKNGTNRVRDLIISLRNFSRLDEAELKQVDLHQGIDNTLLMLKNRLNHKIKLIKDYSELPLLECYPAQINQVWLNILSNAIDALYSDETLTQKQITIRTELNTANLVTVRIQNNGPEIPATIKEQIFDPFFTTKPVGSGTGLGLAIAYQVIEQHHGQIACESNSHGGTEFTITLPVQFSSFEPTG